MLRLGFLLLLPFLLLGCAGGSTNDYASTREVQEALYVSDEPPSVTLISVIHNVSGSGGHTALLINGSHRALWDPAGSWFNDAAPEQRDMIYGMNDTLVQFYINHHARSTYHVVLQEKQVSLATADALIAAFAQKGPANSATCAITTTSVLSQYPGFESLPTRWYPQKVMRDFAELPGVNERKVYQDD